MWFVGWKPFDNQQLLVPSTFNAPMFSCYVCKIKTMLETSSRQVKQWMTTIKKIFAPEDY